MATEKYRTQGSERMQANALAFVRLICEVVRCPLCKLRHSERIKNDYAQFCSETAQNRIKRFSAKTS